LGIPLRPHAHEHVDVALGPLDLTLTSEQARWFVSRGLCIAVDRDDGMAQDLHAVLLGSPLCGGFRVDPATAMPPAGRSDVERYISSRLTCVRCIGALREGGLPVRRPAE
jgi:hypothetical protein